MWQSPMRALSFLTTYINRLINIKLISLAVFIFFFFFQAEDGIRDYKVTGVQTCALPILDTGLAGIHEGGTAFRMDDVPLPLRPSLEAPRTALATVRALRERLDR